MKAPIINTDDFELWIEKDVRTQKYYTVSVTEKETNDFYQFSITLDQAKELGEYLIKS